MGVQRESKREYLARMQGRYLQATRREKGALLDEVVAVTAAGPAPIRSDGPVGPIDALPLLAPSVALRAFAWNVGLAREDAGALLRDAFLAGLLIATIDGWALLAVQVANALSAGISGGAPEMPGAADAARLAVEASLPVSFAPFPEEGDVQRALREREVAGLIAQGLTNREIAAGLVVTERTAATHIEHILNKLGLRNRAQVTAWAVARGLPGS